MKRIRLTKGIFAILDDADYLAASKHRWVASRSRNHFYALRRLPGTGQPGKRQYLHRFLMGDEPDTIDHINGNSLDNRRCNLRGASVASNCQNRPMQADNTTGFKGVTLKPAGVARRKTDGYVAQIKANGSSVIYLGIFPTAEDAARAYDLAAVRYHGEFARGNFL